MEAALESLIEIFEGVCSIKGRRSLSLMITSMNLLLRDSSTYFTGARCGVATLAVPTPGVIAGGAGGTDQGGDQCKLRDPLSLLAN